MSVLVGLKCDACGQAADLELPMKFVLGDGTAAFEVAVIRGPKSLDLCRSCLAMTLMDIADRVAPRDGLISDRFYVLAGKHAPDDIAYERRSV